MTEDRNPRVGLVFLGGFGLLFFGSCFICPMTYQVPFSCPNQQEGDTGLSESSSGSGTAGTEDDAEKIVFGVVSGMLIATIVDNNRAVVATSII